MLTWMACDPRWPDICEISDGYVDADTSILGRRLSINSIACFASFDVLQCDVLRLKCSPIHADGVDELHALFGVKHSTPGTTQFIQD